jgi:hypothetical protein
MDPTENRVCRAARFRRVKIRILVPRATDQRRERLEWQGLSQRPAQGHDPPLTRPHTSAISATSAFPASSGIIISMASARVGVALG